MILYDVMIEHERNPDDIRVIRVASPSMDEAIDQVVLGWPLYAPVRIWGGCQEGVEDMDIFGCYSKVFKVIPSSGYRIDL